MFKFRRLISSVVALSMTAVMFAGVAFAAVPSDVAGTKYEEAAEVLGALEIMVGDADTGNFRPEENITRVNIDGLNDRDKKRLAPRSLVPVCSTDCFAFCPFPISPRA